MALDLTGIWAETTMSSDMKTEGVSAFNMPEGTKCLVNIGTGAVLVPAHPVNPRRVLTLHSGSANLPLPDITYEQIRDAIKEKGTLIEKMTQAPGTPKP